MGEVIRPPQFWAKHWGMHHAAFQIAHKRAKDRGETVLRPEAVQAAYEELKVERLMDCARKHGRYGHRDATMILVAYRHGLRASEVCDLQWHQIELSEGR